jgi:hypothetical protein
MLLAALDVKRARSWHKLESQLESAYATLIMRSSAGKCRLLAQFEAQMLLAHPSGTRNLQ